MDCRAARKRLAARTPNSLTIITRFTEHRCHVVRLIIMLQGNGGWLTAFSNALPVEKKSVTLE